MKDLQENIIPAEGQNEKDYFSEGTGGLKILFVGNSISRHAPKPEVGWTGDWGMAASEGEKDYLHLIVAKIKEKYDPNVSFSIAQVAGYERNFATMDPETHYKEAIDFKADIIVMFFGANVNKEYDTTENPTVKFGDAYEKLRNLFVGGRDNVFVMHSQGFYIRPVLDEEKRAAAKRLGDPFVELGDIQTREETHGRFNHPSDLGMQEIADLFWKTLEPEVAKRCK